MKKKRTMKIVSLILAIVMVVAMLPLSALAGENYPTQKVALVVYSAEFTSMVKQAMEGEATLDTLKEVSEKFVAEGIQVPDVKATLTPKDENLQKVELTEVDGGFNLFKSLQMNVPIVDNVKAGLSEAGSLIAAVPFAENIMKTFKEGVVTKTTEFVDSSIAAVFKTLNVYGSVYRVYVADVPVKDKENGEEYTLKVEQFNKNNDPDAVKAGYILCDDQTSYFYSARESKEIITLREDDNFQFLGSKGAANDVGLKGDLNPLTAINGWLNTQDWYNTIPLVKPAVDKVVEFIKSFLGDTSFSFTFPGLWCAESDAGFTFKNTDLVDNALMNSTFMMVDREELVNDLKIIIDLGKDAIKEVMKAAFSEEYEGYDNLIQLHLQLINSEEGQISLNEEKLFEIVKVYMAVISNMDLLNRIIDPQNATLLTPFKLKAQLPAILKATADENGLVTFNRQSNITLVWILKILPEMQNVAAQVLGNTGVTDKVPEFIKTLFEYAGEAAKLAGDALAEFANGLPYAFAQRFGIVGPKMQDDHYIMLQVKAPTDIKVEGKTPSEYWLNPFAYTMDVKWINADWAYVTLADLGILVPYVAEGLYDFVRNTSFEGTLDKFLGKMTNQEDFDLITRIFSNEIDVTQQFGSAIQGMFNAFIGESAFGALGLDLIFNSKSDFVQGLNHYLWEKGRTAQNLMIYINQQAKKAKSVYAGNLNPVDSDGEPLVDEAGNLVYWQFYNVDKSMTTVATKLIDKATSDISATFENKTKAGIVQKTGETISAIVTNVGTKLEAQTAKVKAQVKEAAKTTVTNIFKATVNFAKNAASNLFSNIGKLFGGKTNNGMITFNA